MDKAGLEMLLLCALFTLTSGVSKEYHFVNSMKTWTEAQSYCRENFADLATIANEEELAEVTSIAEMINDFIWIGLYDDVTSWRWSMDNTNLYIDGKVEFSDWYPNEPNAYASSQSCVAAEEGMWADLNCEHEYLPLCYDASTNEFIPGQTKMTWLSAQSFCREKYTDLASMRNQQEKERLLSSIDVHQIWWIGLFRDTWKWSDGNNLTITNWKHGEPNKGSETCAAQYNTNWRDVPCSWKKQFICYSVRTQVKVLKVELIPGGSVDMNDPVWQEAILKQIEKYMKDQGIHQKFKLSWRKQPDGKIFHKKKKEPKPE